MNQDSFGRLINHIQAQNFSSRKVEAITSAAQSNWFTCNQAARIIQTLSHSKDKIRALEALHTRLVDAGDVTRTYEIVDSLTFSKDKKRAQELLSAASKQQRYPGQGQQPPPQQPPQYPGQYPQPPQYPGQYPQQPAFPGQGQQQPYPGQGQQRPPQHPYPGQGQQQPYPGQGRNFGGNFP